jgi:hypothetical protein
MVKKLAQTPSAPPAPVRTREQLMDDRAAADFAKMSRINDDRTVETRIMTERGARFEAQPSERNSAPQAVSLADMTFSQAGEARFGNSAYMRSRRGRPG